MNKRFPFFILALCCTVQLLAQTPFRHKLAVFAPLYLDSAYNGFQYKHGNTLPRYIIPGLEFYQGVQMALDSMNLEGVPLEVFVYDTKSKSKPFTTQVREMPEVEMIIGAASADEVRILANVALERKIPFISSSFPNDAGVVNNPYFVVLNSTLPAHFRTIYQFLQKTHALHNVVYFRRKSTQDTWLKDLYTETGNTATGTPVKTKFVELDADFTTEDVLPFLDSNTTNICIAGSMDETFSKQLAATIAPLTKEYRSKLIGMPTWDGYRELNKPEYRDLEIVYTAPLYNPRTDKISMAISELYKNKFYSRPSDMVFWGYGAAWKYGRLLLEYGRDVSSNLAVDKFDVFTDYDVQPVLNKQTDTLDYFENKKVYLVSKMNGVVTAAR